MGRFFGRKMEKLIDEDIFIGERFVDYHQIQIYTDHRLTT